MEERQVLQLVSMAFRPQGLPVLLVRRRGDGQMKSCATQPAESIFIGETMHSS
jgi:hypothetical protein